MTAEQQTVKYLEDYAAKLREIILHPMGKTENARKFKQADAAARLAEIREILTDLKAKIGKASTKGITEQYQRGLAVAINQAEKAGVNLTADKRQLLKGTFSIIDRHALQVLAQDTVTYLVKAASSAASNAMSILRATAENGLSQKEINDLIAGRIIGGDRGASVRLLRERLIQVHGSKVIPVGKVHLKAGYYAKMVMRTKSAEAIRKGSINRYQEMGQDLIIILGSRSRNFCTAWLGKVFSISGTSSIYPPLSSLPNGGPPFHPHCTKTVNLYVAAAHTPKQIEDTHLSDDERKMLGQDAAKAWRIWKDLQVHQQRKVA